MIMYKLKHTVCTAAIAAVVSLAGCGDGAEKPAYFSSGGSPPGISSQHESAADEPDMTWPSLVELRHFNVYNYYRAMSDDLSDHMPGNVHGGDETPSATVSSGGGGSAEALTACSARSLIARD